MKSRTTRRFVPKPCLLAGAVVLAVLTPVPALAGPAPVDASPNKVNFGRNTLAFVDAVTVTITNKTNTNFTAGPYSVAQGFDGFQLDSSEPHFSTCVDEDSPPNNGTTRPLAAGASCTMRVKWLGLTIAPGRYLGQMIVAFNANAIGATVDLSGRAVSP